MPAKPTNQPKLHQPPPTKKKKKVKRRYSDTEKAAALLAVEMNDGNVWRASLEVGIPAPTIREWFRGQIHSEITEIRNGTRVELADRCEALAHEMADSLPQKIEEATLLQTTTAMAITIDKMRLLREQPTTISQSHRTVTKDDLLNRLRELAGRTGGRSGGVLERSEEPQRLELIPGTGTAETVVAIPRSPSNDGHPQSMETSPPPVPPE